MERIKRVRIPLLAIVITAIFTLWALSSQGIAFGARQKLDLPQPAPEFTHSADSEWLNSKPLRLKDLRDKVVLLDFWTFGCWNCYRSIPWLHHVNKQFKDQGLQLIGVHSPEFDHERDLNKVKEKLKEFKIEHPVMIDNDFSYWRAMKNQYWPTYYVIDKRGQIRKLFIGETHVGDRRAEAIENLIKKLLAA